MRNIVKKIFSQRIYFSSSFTNDKGSSLERYGEEKEEDDKEDNDNTNNSENANNDDNSSSFTNDKGTPREKFNVEVYMILMIHL